MFVFLHQLLTCEVNPLCCQVVSKGWATCWSSKLGFIARRSRD